MTFQHIDSFVRAVHTVMATMLIRTSKQANLFPEDPLHKYELAVLVGVLGDLQGQVICGWTGRRPKDHRSYAGVWRNQPLMRWERAPCANSEEYYCRYSQYQPVRGIPM